MIGNGQWVTTRDFESINYFLAEIEMQRRLREERRVRRRQATYGLLLRLSHLLHSLRRTGAVRIRRGPHEGLD